MSQPGQPPNADQHFAFRIAVRTSTCPTPESTSRAHLYGRIEDDGGQKKEHARSAKERQWPSKLDAFLGPFRRCVARTRPQSYRRVGLYCMPWGTGTFGAASLSAQSTSLHATTKTISLTTHSKRHLRPIRDPRVDPHGYTN